MDQYFGRSTIILEALFKTLRLKPTHELIKGINFVPRYLYRFELLKNIGPTEKIAILLQSFSFRLLFGRKSTVREVVTTCHMLYKQIYTGRPQRTRKPLYGHLRSGVLEIHIHNVPRILLYKS